jgi:hypothetical protein
VWRRRPKRHIRHVGDKAVIVNDDVTYPADGAVSERVSDVRSAVQLLADDTPVDPATRPVVKIDNRTWRLSMKPRIVGLDQPYQNFSDQKLFDAEIIDGNIAHSLLDGSTLYQTKFRNVDATGASFQDAEFRHCTFGDVSFRGANLTGVNFYKCFFVQGVDFTDSNITGEQFDALEVAGPHSRTITGEPRVIYRRYSIGELAAELNIDSDELAIRVWAGEVEVRHNDTLEKVDPGRFDASIHHISQWEAQRLSSHGG